MVFKDFHTYYLLLAPKQTTEKVEISVSVVQRNPIGKSLIKYCYRNKSSIHDSRQILVSQLWAPFIGIVKDKNTQQ